MSSGAMQSEFSDQKQRVAVCYSQWRKARAEDDQGSLSMRTISLRAETINAEERSVDAVLATEAQVPTINFRGGKRSVVDEVWLMRGGELPDRIQIVDSHPELRGDVTGEHVRGSARDLRLEGDQLVARLHFADDPASLALWGKYRDGHMDGLSLTISPAEQAVIRAGQTETVAGRTFRAGKGPLHVTTKWTPRLVSTVIRGADPGAKVRTFQQESESMNKRLRSYLESIGLPKETDEAGARDWMGQLSGRQAEVAKVLDADLPDAALRAALTGLEVNPDDPAKPLDKSGDGEDMANRKAAGGRAGGNELDANADALRAEGQKVERERIASLRKLAGDDVSAELLDTAIVAGWDEAKASRMFLDHIRERRSPSVGPSIHSRSREQDVNVRSLAAGMLIGQNIDPLKHSVFRRDLPAPGDRLTEQDADRGHALRGMSAADLLRECVYIDTGKSYRTLDELLDAIRPGSEDASARSASVSGGTLAYVFSTNVYARLMQGWETIGDSTAGWCDEEDVANFLEQEDIDLEASARLQRLPRGDTAKHATVSDRHETYKIARYAKQFVVDEQDIIDDRLGAIMRMPEEMGEAARQLRPDMVFSLLIENPTMADTGAVFNATAVTTAGGHANLGTAALSNDALKTAITAMVKQRIGRTTTDPGRQLNIRPRFLIVPAALEWTARTLTSAAALAKLFADSSDPWYAELNLVAKEGIRTVTDDRIGAIGVMDPRTEAARTGVDTNWFLTMGGNRGLRVAYRRGTGRKPQMRRFVLDRGQWGIGWDINMDIGVKFLEWRTWYKSTGAA